MSCGRLISPDTSTARRRPGCHRQRQELPGYLGQLPQAPRGQAGLRGPFFLVDGLRPFELLVCSGCES
jgi:hypothetical protein